MLNDHDQDLLLRCGRLGHEVTFGYCRRENFGKPCRLILNCWWEEFDVRAFLEAELPKEDMVAVEQAHGSPAPSKVGNLMALIERAKSQGNRKA